jgi:hypothetical protein
VLGIKEGAAAPSAVTPGTTPTVAAASLTPVTNAGDVGTNETPARS